MATKKEQDKKVLKLRKSLIAQEAALEAAKKPVYITSGLFRPSQHSDRGIINVKIASQSELVNATIAIAHRKSALDMLGIEEETHLGSTLEEWVEDFKTRLGVINKNALLDRVRATKEKIETRLLSTSQKRDIEVDDVAEEVANLTKVD